MLEEQVDVDATVFRANDRAIPTSWYESVTEGLC